MKRVSEEAGRGAPGSKQARISQMKAGSQTKGPHTADKQPTERELAAAKAARARLYGGEGGDSVRHLTTMFHTNVILASPAYPAPGLPPDSMK